MKAPRPRRTGDSIRRAASIFAAAAALAGASGGAIAAPTPAEVAVAEALFRDAKALLEQGRYAEACPKLAESQRIDPAGGTLFALALCYEAEGKTASAWVVYSEAKSVAERDRRSDRVKSATEHLTALEKQLSFLVVAISPETSSIAGLELKRDDASLGRATIGVAIPVDPGKHRITASAPGFKAFTTEVEVGPSGDRKTIEIPALEKADEIAPAPLPATTAPPPVQSAPPASSLMDAGKEKDRASDPGSGRRTAGLVLGGFGIVSLGVGGAFGLRAKSQHDDAIARCPSSPCSDAEGVALNQSAGTSALITDVALGVGVAALGTGLVLWITAPRAPSKSAASPRPRLLAMAPAASNGGASLSLAGDF